MLWGSHASFFFSQTFKKFQMDRFELRKQYLMDHRAELQELINPRNKDLEFSARHYKNVKHLVDLMYELAEETDPVEEAMLIVIYSHWCKHTLRHCSFWLGIPPEITDFPCKRI